MTDRYTHVVIGAGALGTGAAYWLSQLGAPKVLLLEQFDLGHTKGASEDHSRIIRHAYHSTDYTRLTHAMFDCWAKVEQESGERLVIKTGGLDLVVDGSPQMVEFDNYRHALEAVGVGWEDLTNEEIRRRWPQWRIDGDVIGMYQVDGGILDIRKANAAHIRLAEHAGVEVRTNTRVDRLDPSDDVVRIHTEHGVIEADHVIVCTASWLERLMPGLGLDWKITLSQEQVSYFTPTRPELFTPDVFPMWIWHGDPLFYGFPSYGEAAVKLGQDNTSRWVTLDERSYAPDPIETELLLGFLRTFLPDSAGPELYSRTCVYDMPADRDFILDHVPGHDRIVVGMGAGHAAKFGSLVGKILAELSLTGTTAYPIEPFRADRPALTDPDFPPVFRLVG